MWRFQKSALVPLRYLGQDAFVDHPKEFLRLGQTVIAEVKERDESGKKVTMSMKLTPDDERDEETLIFNLNCIHDEVERLKCAVDSRLMCFNPGTVVNGTVTQIIGKHSILYKVHICPLSLSTKMVMYIRYFEIRNYEISL